jgi:hypothetical protein
MAEPAVAEAVPHAGAISLHNARRTIGKIKCNADGTLNVAALIAEFAGWSEERHAYETGVESVEGWVLLPMRKQRIMVTRPWQLGADNRAAWGDAWQTLGAACTVDALTLLGAFTRFTRGKPFSLLSTRYASPAKEWAEMVKRDEETHYSAPCFNPNGDNINFSVLKAHDQVSRDGRWLLVFLWCTKLASFTGGRMIQLLIPGLGLSPMQVAEQQIAVLCGVPIEQHVLDAEVGTLLGVTAGDPVLCEGGIRLTKLKALVAGLTVDGAAIQSKRDVLRTTLQGKPVSALRKRAVEEGAETDEIDAALDALDIKMQLVQLILSRCVPDAADTAVAAAEALSKLAIEAENVAAIVQAGALPPLIVLLGESSAAARYAASAIANLASGNADNKVTIIKAGALTSLIALLSGGEEKAQENAAAALWNLVTEDSHIAIVQAGALPPLIALLDKGSAKAQANAAGALKLLSFNNADNKVAIVQEGALSSLIVLLDKGSAWAQENAAVALANLANGNAENKASIVKARALTPLVMLLHRGLAGAQAAAARALQKLASNDVDNQNAIAHAGALPPLVALYKGGSSTVVQTAAESALQALTADNDDNRCAVESLGYCQLSR